MGNIAVYAAIKDSESKWHSATPGTDNVGLRLAPSGYPCAFLPAWCITVRTGAARVMELPPLPQVAGHAGSVAGLPRKPKLPFADRYSTYARSFSKTIRSFPTGKNCALLSIASAIPQNGAIRFVWQSLSPHQSTPVPTKQMPYPCNHRQQGLFVPPQDYPCRCNGQNRC